MKTIAAVLLLLSVGVPAMPPLHAAPAVALMEKDAGDLDLAATKSLFDNHSVCFVDARSEFAYYTSHIKGARSLSDSRFDEQFPEFREKTPKTIPIVVYCISPTCSKAKHVAEKLKKNGYSNVRIFPGGMSEWSNARFPIEVEQD